MSFNYLFHYEQLKIDFLAGIVWFIFLPLWGAAKTNIPAAKRAYTSVCMAEKTKLLHN